MKPWDMDAWKENGFNNCRRNGLRLRTESGVDSEVKRACKEFAKWLRGQYIFPQRVNVYIKSAYYIKAMDGDLVSGTCFWPYDKVEEPYIKIAAGDYEDLVRERGKDNALAAILHTMAHELTHYFQWINNLDEGLSDKQAERQAVRCAGILLDRYAETREHP